MAKHGRPVSGYSQHGPVQALVYEQHVQSLVAQLAQVIAPEKMSQALVRVERTVAAGKMTRIQALTSEIVAAEQW